MDHHRLSLEGRLESLCSVFLSGRIATLSQAISRLGPSPRKEDEFFCLEEANQLLAALDDEVIVVFNLLKDRYTKRFPEIDSFSLGAVDYAKTVLTIGATIDLTRIDFTLILPPTTVLAMAMPAATTLGQPLSSEELANVIRLANLIIEMDQGRKGLLLFLETRMSKIAPNVSAIVGTKVASQLVGVAGGIIALSKIPAGNIHVLGRAKKELSGFSKVHTNPHAGYIYESDLVGNTPSQYKSQAQRLIANKVALAARIDAQGQSPDGNYGKELRQKVIEKLEKLLEPAPMSRVKPIPPPPIESSKKRGGRRARQQKELYAQTQIRKMTNRLEFGKPEAEIIVGSSVLGLGELGAGSSSGTGTGRLRMPVLDNKLREHLKKASQKAYAGTLAALSRPSTISNPSSSSSSSTITPLEQKISGTTTSLRVTPGHGIQLETIPVKRLSSDQTGKYFGNSLSFRK